jgi:hypothetical protein
MRQRIYYRSAGPPGAQLEDTDGMNRERAETFLRLLDQPSPRYPEVTFCSPD